MRLCLNKNQQWPPLPPPQALPWDQVQSSSWSSQPQIQCTLWCGVSRAGVFAQAGVHSESAMRKLASSRAELSASCLGLISALLMSTVQASPVFPSDSVVLQTAKGSCLLLVGLQDWNTQSGSQPAHSYGRRLLLCSPFSSQSPPRDRVPNLITVLHFLPKYMCILLRALVA